MRLKFAFIILLMFLLSCNLLKSEQKYKFNQTIYFLLGYPAGPNAPDFFKIYKKYIGGSNDVLRQSPIIGAGTKFSILKNIRIGLLGYYYQCTFRDFYSQAIYPMPESPLRWVAEDIKINNYPVFFTTEFNPNLKSQFNTYCGIGVGCNFGKIEWLETVSGSIPEDKRKGGLIYNQPTYSLITRAYLGMELGFDKKHSKYLLGGLIFEVAYIYDSKRINIFDEFNNQFIIPHKEFSDKYNIIPGIFELSTAVSFNFD